MSFLEHVFSCGMLWVTLISVHLWFVLLLGTQVLQNLPPREEPEGSVARGVRHGVDDTILLF